MHHTSGALEGERQEIRMQVPLPLGPANAQMRPPWASIMARGNGESKSGAATAAIPTGWV